MGRRFEAEAAIYVFHDPSGVSQRIYVGMTTANMESYRRWHVRRADGSSRRMVHRWIASLLARNVEPAVEILEIVPPLGDWEDAERFWIAYYRFVGAKMANQASGGEGAPLLSEAANKERVRKMTESWRTRPRPVHRFHDEGERQAMRRLALEAPDDLDFRAERLRAREEERLARGGASWSDKPSSGYAERLLAMEERDRRPAPPCRRFRDLALVQKSS